MTKHNPYLILSILTLLCLAGGLNAQQKFVAVLSPSQVVPATSSNALGLCKLSSNAAETQADVTCNLSSSPIVATAIHIHGDAPVGVNAPILFDVPFRAGSSNGSFGTSFNVTPAQAASIRANRWYVDLHSASFPNGEIRGQFKLANGTYNDYDGDGRTDLTVYRFSDNSFYARRSTDNSLFVRQIGQAGDSVSLTVDFDGDGRSDFSTARYNTPVIWRILNSTTDTVQETVWGSSSSGDFFAAADYDGDGRYDIAIFRAGVWYIVESSTGAVRYDYWGRSGDIPAPNDFDGDGKADLAIARSENGQRMWYIRRSSDAQMQAVQFGLSSDSFFIGRTDFDADGAADILVVRNVSGQRIFYILRSSDSQMQAIPWGLSSDLIKLGDYDGDGRTDTAVIRTVDGSKVWYILQSSNGEPRIEIFGISGDF